MTKEEQTILQGVLADFDQKDCSCLDRINFLSEHNFPFEKQAAEIEKTAYRKCYNRLAEAINQMKQQGAEV